MTGMPGRDQRRGHLKTVGWFTSLHCSGVPGLPWRSIMIVAAAFFFGALGLIADVSTGAPEQRFPDIVAVKVEPRGGNTFNFDVTVSSPYDTAQRYADGFRVSGPDGRVYGERKLFHDHAGEQPFTRDLHGVAIPDGIKTVVVQARDQKYGYGGKTVEVNLPGR
jgi:hypothetical protein